MVSTNPYDQLYNVYDKRWGLLGMTLKKWSTKGRREQYSLPVSMDIYLSQPDLSRLSRVASILLAKRPARAMGEGNARVPRTESKVQALYTPVSSTRKGHIGGRHSDFGQVGLEGLFEISEFHKLSCRIRRII